MRRCWHFRPVLALLLALPALAPCGMIAQSGVVHANDADVVSNEEGKRLAAKVIEAVGGKDKLIAIKSFRTKAIVTLKAQGGVTLEAERIQLLPDKVRNSMATPNGTMVMVVTPQDSFMDVTGIGLSPLPAFQREEQINAFRRNVWYVAQHLSDPKYVFSAQGTEKIGDVEAEVLLIRDDTLQQWRWYVDPQTGYILRARFQITGPTGSGTRVVDFSQWKATDGVTLPFHEELSTDGEATGGISILSYEFNPKIDLTIFEKPAQKAQRK
jgi:hypothetical protein